MELITHCVKWVIRLNVYKIDWEVPAWNSQSGTDWVWQTRADTPILEAKMTVKILQRLAKKCSTKKLLRNLTQKFGREKLFNTIGKRLQNSNLWVFETSTEASTFCRDASANVDQDASTFSREAGQSKSFCVDRDHVVGRSNNVDRKLQPFWDASVDVCWQKMSWTWTKLNHVVRCSFWFRSAGFHQKRPEYRLGPRGLPFRCWWGSFTAGDLKSTELTQISTEKTFQLALFHTKFQHKFRNSILFQQELQKFKLRTKNSRERANNRGSLRYFYPKSKERSLCERTSKQTSERAGAPRDTSIETWKSSLYDKWTRGGSTFALAQNSENVVGGSDLSPRTWKFLRNWTKIVKSNIKCPSDSNENVRRKFENEIEQKCSQTRVDTPIWFKNWYCFERQWKSDSLLIVTS